MTIENDNRHQRHAAIDPDHVTDVLDRSDETLVRLRTALRGLKYGTVTAVVQDGVVVQVERTEKIRLDRRDRER